MKEININKKNLFARKPLFQNNFDNEIMWMEV